MPEACKYPMPCSHPPGLTKGVAPSWPRLCKQAWARDPPARPRPCMTPRTREPCGLGALLTATLTPHICRAGPSRGSVNPRYARAVTCHLLPPPRSTARTLGVTALEASPSAPVWGAFTAPPCPTWQPCLRRAHLHLPQCPGWVHTPMYSCLCILSPHPSPTHPIVHPHLHATCKSTPPCIHTCMHTRACLSICAAGHLSPIYLHLHTHVRRHTDGCLRVHPSDRNGSTHLPTRACENTHLRLHTQQNAQPPTGASTYEPGAHVPAGLTYAPLHAR